MASPILDPRSADDIYQQALVLAKAYCPEWSGDWPATLDAAAVDQDPGLVLLNLFSLLGKYLVDIENQVPVQRWLAFYQFLNLQLRPPVAAQAPLTFALRTGQAPRLVPAWAAVLDAPTQKIRFETAAPLLVVPADLAVALTVIPAQDQSINALPWLGSGTSVPIFTIAEDSPAQKPLGHWFLLGDGALFRPDPALQHITLRLTGTNLHPAYFAQWFDGGLNPLKAEVIGPADGLSLDITLLDMPQAPAISIGVLQQALYAADGGSGEATGGAIDAGDTATSFWLVVKPSPSQRILTVLDGQLPVITGIACIVSGDDIPAEQAASNQAMLDISNGGYPFGQTPAPNDIFYLRSDSVFAKAGAQVTLTFTLRPVNQAHKVTVAWQYWSGSSWASFNETAVDINLHQFTDTTSNLQGNAFGVPTTISFVCPVIEPTTVAGTKGRWIRAVLTQGSYGTLGGYTSEPVDATINAISGKILNDEQKKQVIDYLTKTEGVSFSFHFESSSYAPPYIAGLSLAYRLPSRPTRFWSYNAFELTRFLFSPFKPPADPYAAFHFGFTPEEFVRYSRGQPLSLFFHLAGEGTAPRLALVWQYFDGAAWQILAVDDGTEGLTRSGIVRFTVPAAMTAATLFSRTLCWFRIVDGAPGPEVRLYGLYPNSVAAMNAVGVVDDILGSANGQPSQTFQLSHTPVLPGLVLDVVEPQGLQPEDGPLTVTPPDTTPGTSGQVRRRWKQVDTFAFSGPAERVYTLDTADGLVTFGDGRNGMVPPPGHDNIIAAAYNYTDGLSGNVDAGVLTVLRPGISDITGVHNPVAAIGGADGDTRDVIATAGPARVRANGRAVDASDLGTLAEESSPQVARARALVDQGPAIRITVLPRSAAPRPVADPALLDRVRVGVTAACLAPLASRLTVAGVDYLPVAVTAQITSTVPIDQRLVFQQAVADRLTRFLHPVFGGLDGTGWGIGQAVRASSIVTLLRGDSAITGVPGLSLNGQPFTDVPMGPGLVAAAGAMAVYVYGQGELG